MKNAIPALSATIAIFFVCLSIAFSQTKSGQLRSESLLAHLVGSWDMQGDVEGKPVKYSLDAGRVLHDKLVLMHMKDLAIPSPYEADVYIGYDTTRACYVTFWLDNFGVDSVISVLGYGSRQGDALIILFGFPNEPFRDTFTYDSTSDTWRFLLEDGNLQGVWKTFADYKLTRKNN
jgi:hypothetical protein